LYSIRTSHILAFNAAFAKLLWHLLKFEAFDANGGYARKQKVVIFLNTLNAYKEFLTLMYFVIMRRCLRAEVIE